MPFLDTVSTATR